VDRWASQDSRGADMIHYHGTPITPNSAAVAALSGGHAFVSFARPDQLGIAIETCQSFAIDNGAFSSWKTGKPITEWGRYYCWIAELQRYPGFDFAVIPDVIDGSEEDNDRLIDEWPWKSGRSIVVGAPVWHMHESIARLLRLANDWPRVCVGSSGEYATVGDARWWVRMAEAMNSVCDRNGNPICKLHGLRMLSTDVFTRLPLSSADSTNIARNVGIDSRWKGAYAPASKDCRATILRGRIEASQATTFWDRQPEQARIFA
jgi:hypothetical protein